MPCLVSVLVPLPAYGNLPSLLHYESELALAPGALVRVPLGRREVLGIVWDSANAAQPQPDTVALRPVAAVFDALAPLPANWRRLVEFTARYYQRAMGEVAHAALPPQLRELGPAQLAQRVQNMLKAQAQAQTLAQAQMQAQAGPAPEARVLTPEQAQVLAHMAGQRGPFLLYGSTGSGKTEVYMRAISELLAHDAQVQALIMVPEINLTPQLQSRLAERFGAHQMVCMHSSMTNAQRLRAWLAAHTGQARILLGTRMAVLASMPQCRLIVVDEEHDPSYKQQEGARYSARDLAVYRGQLESAQVLLGSATPSLESWHHSRLVEAGPASLAQPPAAGAGRYLRLYMPSRIGTAKLPQVRVVDMRLQPKQALICPPLLDAIKAAVARAEQVLLLLNRRGYAPVLHCADCGWRSQCPHCSAYRVFHKIDRSLRCHHCGLAHSVPRACPDCGNADITALGRGTEQLQEHVAQLLSTVQGPQGQALRIGRIDADTTRLKDQLATQLAQVHAGEVDVLVGTQMIAKGHDFRRVSLVAAINPDTALFSSDFRASERLFALLMQAAGRAGRDAASGVQGQMWLQTHFPAHPLYAALKAHDYPAFASQQLHERQQAGLPPYSFQALLRAEARTQEAAQRYLDLAAAQAGAAASSLGVVLYSAVPMPMQRIANVERAQMLVESTSRSALQRFLAQWQPVLHSLHQQKQVPGLLRWAVDVDPVAI